MPAAAWAQVAPLPIRQGVTPPAPDPDQSPRADVDTQGAFATSNCPFADSQLCVSLSPAATKPPAVPALAAPAPSSPAETLDSFWARFRKVALAHDVNGIAALSAPIVTQYGLLDDSPQYRLSAAKAAAVLIKFLDDPNVTDGNNRTNRQQLEATPKVALNREWSTDRLSFGDMEFAHGPKGWRLVSFYYEP